MIRYPFSHSVLDALPEELAELFRDLELKLLEEICSRLRIADQLNEVTVQDIRALRAHGIDLEDIKKAIRDATDTGGEKLNALLDDVVKRNQKYYTEMIDLANVTAPERLVDESDIAAIRRQTWGAYKNITGSMGFLTVQGGRLVISEPAKVYERCLDNALMQIQSGAISYNQAISEQVKTLADRGLCVAFDKNGNPLKNRVAYESGHIDHLDVAVRRAVMTGVNQLNQKYREQSMDYLETDLIEVTAHLGARNTDGPNGWENHAKWQGKVYRWRKDGGGYTAPERQAAPTPPAPVRQEMPAIPSPQSAESRRTAAVDVTQEYLDAAAPGQGKVFDIKEYERNGQVYIVDGHNVLFDPSPRERQVAQLIADTFGKEVKLLPKISKPEYIKTPDYLIDGVGFDLKEPEGQSKNVLYNMIHKKKEQACNFVFDISKCPLDFTEIQRQISALYKSPYVEFLDTIILVKGDKVLNVYRRG